MVKKICRLFLFILFVCGGVIMFGCVRWADGKTYDIAALNANPKLMSDISLQDGRIGGLKIENVTLHNTTFKNIILDKPIFKNVIFENCNFTKAHFYGAIFENVVFKSGSMSSGINEDDYYRTEIDGLFTNVIFDGIHLSDAELNIVGNNKVIFKNITGKLQNNSITNIFGSGYVYIDSCVISGYQFVSMHDESKIYAKNSSFIGSGFAGSQAEVIYAENCLFNRASLGKAKVLVVKDSKVHNSRLVVREKMFLVNNDYGKSDANAINGAKSSSCFVLGSTNKQAPINIFGGNVYIYDLEILDSVVRTAVGRDYIPITSLNLKNVTIRSGKWKNLKLKGGQWENVKIYPPVDITNAKIENLKGYNVTFPEGTPWTRTSGGEASMTVSKTPFEWPEVHVPTPEDLGLD